MIPNPRAGGQTIGEVGDRELVDGEFVNVSCQGVQPVKVLAMPRAAVLSDQQGDYVYVVGAGNKVEQRRVQLGQSTPTVAAITSGLKEGERVVTEGMQRVRPGHRGAGRTGERGPRSGGQRRRADTRLPTRRPGEPAPESRRQRHPSHGCEALMPAFVR